MDDESTLSSPGKKRSKDRRERRHRLILDIATELFIRNGYHATTTEDIARHGQFSVGLIYRHFSKKEDLLFEAIQSTNRRILREVPDLVDQEDEPLKRFLVAVAHYHRIDMENKESSILGIRESKSLSKDRIEQIKELELSSTRIISHCIDDCIEAGVFHAVDVEMLTYQVVMHVHNWALNAWRFSPRRRADAYLEVGLRHLLVPILSDGNDLSPFAASIMTMVRKDDRPPKPKTAKVAREARS
jgi:TetR/AcrR family transcriptional regulator, cholesterol catabolism regulator